MKLAIILITAVVFFGVQSGVGWAFDSAAARGTTPPTSIRSGLVRSPNPIDTSSNLVITGNVSGGRQFRGGIPYQSPTSFYGAPGSALHDSSYLDSFLRQSGGIGDRSNYSGRLTPYYSQTRTVTRTMPGQTGVIRPPTPGIGGGIAGKYGFSALPRKHYLSKSDAGLSGIDFRSMSMSREELERLVSSKIDKYSPDKSLMVGQYEAELAKLRQDLEQASNKTGELKEGPTERDKWRGLRTLEALKSDLPRPFEAESATRQESGEGLQGQKRMLEVQGEQPDVFEKMKLDAEELQKALEQVTAAKEAAKAVADEGKPGEGKLDLSKNIYLKDGLQDTSTTGLETATEKSSQWSDVPGFDLHSKAQSIMNEHKTFESFAEARYHKSMRTAEEYMVQGKYYLAADIYTLASLYKPGDAFAYAGKSRALFAAGEYMSSALFLCRVLEICPEYAKVRIDIEGIIGDRDKLESRVTDVEQWLQHSGAPELQFLLAYVYYQMGRLERAGEAIAGACEKMPDSAAATALKKAIDEAAAASHHKNK